MKLLIEKTPEPEFRADLASSFAGLFTPSLELPEGEGMLENVCWYASGGEDFRPVVYFSEHYRRRKGPPLDGLTTPSLFVYTCIGGEFGYLDKAVREEKPFYRDAMTSISADEFHRLHIDREAFGYEIDDRYIDPWRDDVLDEVGYDAFLCKLTLEDLRLGVSEDCWLLYLACENINFFENVVRRGLLKVRHLVAIREGLAFGSCRKSVIEHVYGDRWERGDPDRLDGFEPETVTTSEGGSLDMLRRSCWMHDIHWRPLGFCIDPGEPRVMKRCSHDRPGRYPRRGR